MKITTTDEAGVKVVSFEGKIDTSTSPEAEGHLEHLLGEGATKILLDFERLLLIKRTAGTRSPDLQMAARGADAVRMEADLQKRAVGQLASQFDHARSGCQHMDR